MVSRSIIVAGLVLGAAVATGLVMRPGARAADPAWTPEPTPTPGPSWPALTEAGPFPTPVLLAGPMDLVVDLHALPGAWSLGSGMFVASDGTELTWSRVTSWVEAGHPYLGEIVAFAPRSDPEPVVIYHDPEPDTRIFDTAVRAGRYAFLELNERLLGAGWRLWALPSRGGERVLLDTADGPDIAPVPRFTLTDDRVIWTAVHPRDGVLTYELRSARFDGSDDHALLSSPVSKRQYWYPTTDPAGTHALYATVEPKGHDWRYRIWSLDLTDPAARPVRLGTSDEATQPLTNGTVLVWRIVDGNVQNSGRDLVMAALDGSDPVRLHLSRPFLPSLGNRFLVEQDARQEVVLYDMTAKGRPLVLERLDAHAGWILQRGWAVVAGDLLVFQPVVYLEDHAPGIETDWAFLPAVGEPIVSSAGTSPTPTEAPATASPPTPTPTADGMAAWTGIAWSRAGSIPTGSEPNAIVRWHDRWVVAGADAPDRSGRQQGGLWSSEDLVHWTRIVTVGEPGGIAAFTELLSLPDRLVAMGHTWPIACGGNGPVCGAPESMVWTSVDGVAWAEVTGSRAPAPGRVLDATFGHGAIVAVGDSGWVTPMMWRSTDGLRWETQVLPPEVFADAHLLAVVSTADGWVVTGMTRGHELHCCDDGWDVDETQPMAWWSPDGVAWERATMSPGASETGAGLDQVFVGARGLVATDPGEPTLDPSTGREAQPQLWTSTDGRAWSAAFVDPETGSRPVVSDGTAILAMDIRGELAVSTDGLDWRPLPADGTAPGRTTAMRWASMPAVWLTERGVLTQDPTAKGRAARRLHLATPDLPTAPDTTISSSP